MLRRVALLALLLSAGCRKREAPQRDPAPPVDATPIDHARHRWSKIFSTTDTLPRDIAIDSTGNAVIVGRFNDKANWGLGFVDPAGSSDAFVIALADDGAVRWARAVGGWGWDEARGVALANDGRIFLGGQFDKKSIAVLDASGITLSTKMALDGEGEVLGVAVSPKNDAAFGGWGLRKTGCPGKGRHALATFDADENARGSTCLDGDFSKIQRVAFDSSGDVVVCGVFRHTLDFGGIVHVKRATDAIYVASMPDELFVARVARDDGKVLWARTGLGSASASCQALATSKSGAIAVGGAYAGTLEIGGTKLPNPGYREGFVVSWERDGTPRFAFAIADAQFADEVSGLAFADDGTLVVTGTAGTKATSLGPSANEGTFLAAFDAHGALSWAKRFKGGVPVGLGRSRFGYLIAGHLYASDKPDTADLGGELLRTAPLMDGGSSRFDLFAAAFSP